MCVQPTSHFNLADTPHSCDAQVMAFHHIPLGAWHLPEGSTSVQAPRESLPTTQAEASVDAGELHYLILHYLAQGPCQEAVAALQQEAPKNGLLPTRTDVFGGGP